MNKLEWEAKLAEVAEWEMPKLNATEIKTASKGRKTKEEQYQNAHEQEFMEIFNGVNPTHTPVVTKIHSQPTTCDDCGKHCPNGRHKEKKVYEANGNKHWREKCITCGMSQNPFTKQFDLTVAEASSRWANYWRDVKGIYKTERNEQRKEHNVIITSYPDGKDQ
jgi:epoxyqueuosine reductase QueG